MKTFFLSLLAVSSASAADAVVGVDSDKAAAVTATEDADLPDYCSLESDFECYKKGWPKCCVNKKKQCRAEPRCDVKRTSRRVVSPGGICRKRVDACARGHSCVDDRCVVPRNANVDNAPGGMCLYDSDCVALQRSAAPRASTGPGLCDCYATSSSDGFEECEGTTNGCRRARCVNDGVPSCSRRSVVCAIAPNDNGFGRCIFASQRRIPRNGACRRGIDVCVDGYDCANGRCVASLIPRNGACRRGIDVCIDGYDCINRRCVVPRNGVCRRGIDICRDGYDCINGRCVASLIPRNGACRRGIDVCIDGYDCINGRCVSPLIPRNGACRRGIDVCIDGYDCINGRCVTPFIPRNGICRRGIDVCVNGYDCINGRCIVPSAGGTIGLNGDCTNHKNSCQPGLSCQPSQVNGSDRWFCQRYFDTEQNTTSSK